MSFFLVWLEKGKKKNRRRLFFSTQCVLVLSFQSFCFFPLSYSALPHSPSSPILPTEEGDEDDEEAREALIEDDHGGEGRGNPTSDATATATPEHRRRRHCRGCCCFVPKGAGIALVDVDRLGRRRDVEGVVIAA